jgi:hypothetical protein
MADLDSSACAKGDQTIPPLGDRSALVQESYRLYAQQQQKVIITL